MRSSRPELFGTKGVLKNFAKFTGNDLCQSFFFNKVADLRPATLLKKRLWHRCFSTDFCKILRRPFFTEHFQWLLCYFYEYYVLNSIQYPNEQTSSFFSRIFDLQKQPPEVFYKKKVFLKVSQNSQERNCGRVSF